MNFYTLRIVITLLILAIIFLIYRFLIKRKTKNINRVLIVLISLLIMMVWDIPFEKKIMNFKTVKSSFKYSFPLNKIIKMYTSEDYVFIFHMNKSKYNVSHYIKSRNSWSIIKPKFENQNRKGFYNGYFVYINNIEEKNVTAVFIVYPDIVSKKEITISDSLMSDFDFIKYKDNYIYSTLIKENLKKSYTLIINGKKYYPLK